MTTLNHIAKIVMGQSPSGDSCNNRGIGIPLLNGPTEFGPDHPTPTQWTTTPKKESRTGDLLFCVRGSTTGRMNQSDRPYAIGRGIAAIRSLKLEHQQFVNYAVKSRLPNLLTNASGSVFPNLTAAQIGSIRIPDFSSSASVAIAEVLGALDDKIAANRKLVATIGELMVALVEDLPTDSKLAEIALLRKDQIQPEAMPRTVSHYSLPLFDEGALPGHELSQTIKSSKFVLAHPSVLLSKLNPRFPRIWNVPEPERDSVASTEFLVLEPRVMTTATLWALLSTTRVEMYLQEHVSGTTGSHQRFKPDQALVMPMPGSVPPELRDTLTSLGDRAVAARYESQTLAELRDTLLPALMDGTIRVKDAEKTAEEVL